MSSLSMAWRRGRDVVGPMNFLLDNAQNLLYVWDLLSQSLYFLDGETLDQRPNRHATL
jgi:hypothetical protein